jgi:translation initiation factor IF-3
VSLNKQSTNAKLNVRINQSIRAKEVLLINQDGQSLGVMPIQQALQKAQAVGLDLIEVSASANPPVCKILDFGKYRYEQSKRERENRKHNVAAKLKEIQIHMNIDPHDYEIKLRAAERFLWKGMKVKFSLNLRGREIVHQSLGEQLINKVRSDIAHIGIAESEPKFLGKSITMLLNPLPQQKRTRKYIQEEHADELKETEETTRNENEESLNSKK